MMQHGIDVIEDAPLGDLPVVVMLAEMLQSPVGDVVAAFCAPSAADVKG
jgi:hypothetical protein